MSEQNDFDTRLAARFEQERASVPVDAFVANTMRKVRAERRRREFLHVGSRVAALAAIVIASPWLIAGVERLNAAVDSSFTWARDQSVGWVLGAVVILVVLAMRARSR